MAITGLATGGWDVCGETAFTEDDRRRLDLIEQTVAGNSEKLDLLLNMLAEQEE